MDLPEKLVILDVVDQFLLHPGSVLALAAEHPAGELVPVVRHYHVLLQLLACLAHVLAGVTRVAQYRFDLLVFALGRPSIIMSTSMFYVI